MSLTCARKECMCVCVCETVCVSVCVCVRVCVSEFSGVLWYFMTARQWCYFYTPVLHNNLAHISWFRIHDSFTLINYVKNLWPPPNKEHHNRKGMLCVALKSVPLSPYSSTDPPSVPHGVWVQSVLPEVPGLPPCVQPLPDLSTRLRLRTHWAGWAAPTQNHDSAFF